MNTFLMIVGIHAVLLGFAFLLAGIMSLLVPSQAESEAQRRGYEIMRAKSWFHGLIFALRQVTSARSRGFSLAMSHWHERPQSRQLIYAAVVCLAIAAIIGYHFGVFNS